MVISCTSFSMFRNNQIEKLLKLLFLLMTIVSVTLLLFGFLFTVTMHSYIIDFGYLKYFFSTFTPLILVSIYSFLAYKGLKQRKKFGNIMGFSTIIPLIIFYVSELFKYSHPYIYRWDSPDNLIPIIFLTVFLLMLFGLLKVSKLKLYKFLDYAYLMSLSLVLFITLTYKSTI